MLETIGNLARRRERGPLQLVLERRRERDIRSLHKIQDRFV